MWRRIAQASLFVDGFVDGLRNRPVHRNPMKDHDRTHERITTHQTVLVDLVDVVDPSLTRRLCAICTVAIRHQLFGTDRRQIAPVPGQFERRRTRGSHERGTRSPGPWRGSLGKSRASTPGPEILRPPLGTPADFWKSRANRLARAAPREL
jgi:hypothetical protein